MTVLNCFEGILQHVFFLSFSYLSSWAGPGGSPHTLSGYVPPRVPGRLQLRLTAVNSHKFVSNGDNSHKFVSNGDIFSTIANNCLEPRQFFQATILEALKASGIETKKDKERIKERQTQ